MFSCFHLVWNCQSLCCLMWPEVALVLSILFTIVEWNWKVVTGPLPGFFYLQCLGIGDEFIFKEAVRLCNKLPLNNSKFHKEFHGFDPFCQFSTVFEWLPFKMKTLKKIYLEHSMFFGALYVFFRALYVFWSTLCFFGALYDVFGALYVFLGALYVFFRALQDSAVHQQNRWMLQKKHIVLWKNIECSKKT